MKLSAVLTFSKGHFLDGSRTSIALDGFNTLNSLRHQLGNQIVSIKYQGYEEFFGRDRASELISECDDSHDYFACVFFIPNLKLKR